MLSDLAQAGTKALGGARFSLVNILPGAVLGTVVVAAARSGAYGHGEVSLDRIFPQGGAASAGAAILYVFALFVFGVLLQPFQIALVQLLEGYWGQGVLGRNLGRLAVERHRRRYTTALALQDWEPASVASKPFAEMVTIAKYYAAGERLKGRADALLKQLPVEPDHLMPTMLGNILRNGEDSAGDRYGLDALVAYPRMYPSLSKPLGDAMSRQLDVIAVTAGMCVCFVLSALATTPLVTRLDRWSAVPAVLLLLGLLAYRGALRAAAEHATLFATTFDLHRFDMLRTLHYGLPATAEKERVFNHNLTNFLSSRQPPRTEVARYEHPQPETIPANAAVPPSGENAEEPGRPGQ